MSWVLDTNVVVKWFLQEDGSDRAATYLDRLLEGSAEVLVPSLLFYELANVLWVRKRDGVNHESSARIWEDLLELPLWVIDWQRLLPGSLGLAYEHGISPYDAVFVKLAEARNLHLVTADRPLWKKTRDGCPWVKFL